MSTFIHDKNFSYTDYAGGGSEQQQRLWTLSLSHNQQIGTRPAARTGIFRERQQHLQKSREGRNEQLTRRLQPCHVFHRFARPRQFELQYVGAERFGNGSLQRTPPGYNFNWCQAFFSSEGDEEKAR
jgi:hypothetical protein